MSNKIKLQLSIFVFFILIVSLSFSVSALTGKIGNLKINEIVEIGDTVDRTIRVINDNDISINVTLFLDGDLENEIELIDEKFTLGPGEEKKARFIYEADTLGKTLTRINVQFAPAETKGNGVGLSSQVTINVIGEGEIPPAENTDDTNDNSNDDSSDSSSNNDNTIIEFVPKFEVKAEGNQINLLTGKSISSVNPIGKNAIYLIGIGLTTIVLLVLLLVLLIFSKKKSKKRGRGGDVRKIKAQVEEKWKKYFL